MPLLFYEQKERVSDMTVISNSAIVEAGKRLLEQSKQQMIPYVLGGMTLAGMDCQGLCEYLLIQCGLTREEVNLAGSNAHWRKSFKWRGTVEEAVALFGDIPDGAWLFIHSEGYNSKYGDNDGDASHMGQYLGGLVAVHASASRGFVAESAVRRKSINGGWNMVGLSKWVRFSDDVERKIGGDIYVGGNADEVAPDDETGMEAVASIIAPVSSHRYVRVKTADGNGVRAREQPNREAIYKYTVPEGTVLQVLADKGDFFKVHYLGKARYVDKRFVVAHEK